MTNISEAFIESLLKFCENRISDEVYFQTKMCIADYVACTYLGKSMFLSEDTGLVKEAEKNYGNTLILGTTICTTQNLGALINGMNSHYSELDDGNRFGMVHLGTPVITAVLAYSDNNEMQSEQFLKAIIYGYEVTTRLACAIQPAHKLKGFHATGTCGTIGAALGIALALGYSREEIHTVLSCAATDATAILQLIDEGSELKPYNVARAVVAALNAVCMGKTNLKGPKDVLGGERGFFKIFADEVKTELLLCGFANKYAIELIYRKPYAACRHCHAGIEAAIELRNQHEFNIADINTVSVETYSLAVKGHDHIDIEGVSSAKMSIPYSVAVALIYGKASFQQYDEKVILNKEVIELTKKVHVREEKELSALVPEKRVAIVTIKTNAKSYSKRVEIPKGEPENPMTVDELKEKYFSLMIASGVEQEKANMILDAIWNIDDDIRTLKKELRTK